MTVMKTPFYKPIVCPVLIDRVDELAILHELIDQAKSGRGHVALLSGEAGVGKSRLVAETKAYAAAQAFVSATRETVSRQTSPVHTLLLLISCGPPLPTS
jgi:putative ribosome biogenesis GTPase RsgA